MNVRYKILALVCGIYLGDYYHTDFAAVQAFSDINKTTVRTLDDGTIVFEPDAPTKALIFLPGRKSRVYGISVANGMQDGDGIPKIINEEQIHITAEQICDMIK